LATEVVSINDLSLESFQFGLNTMAITSILALGRKIERALEDRRVERMNVPVTKEILGLPTIYFLTPDTEAPSGGVFVIYRHVDLLNSAGIRAFVLHQRPGFRCNWFTNHTLVTDVTKARVGSGDLLVVSEPYVCLMCGLPKGTRHAVLNQSLFLTWKRGGERVVNHYKTNSDLVGIVTVSDYCAEALRYGFSRTPVYRVRPGIDASLFHLEDGPRERRIAYMSKKGKEDAERVLRLLEGRGSLAGWKIVPIDGLNHSDVARELRASKLFLTFSLQEGFGLPIAEAMACGNYVIGYHGYGGRELLRPGLAGVVEAGDVLAFARAVEDAVENDRHDPHWCLDRGRAASKYILAEYSLEREREDVLNAYSSLLARAPAPSVVLAAR
jgi:hypothetical protein